MAVHRKMIRVDSAWGAVTRNPLQVHAEGSPTLAVLFPGIAYGCDAPLLYYARKAALLAGCDTLSLEYGFQVVRTQPETEQVWRLGPEAVNAIRQALQPTHRHLLFISKSLGTIVAGHVASRMEERPIAHLFLTPVGMSLPYLKRFGGTAIYGSADASFDEEARRQIRGQQNLELIEIPGAGHSLELEDQLEASLQILAQVAAKCAEIAKGLVGMG